jgi:hypothetical protein
MILGYGEGFTYPGLPACLPVDVDFPDVSYSFKRNRKERMAAKSCDGPRGMIDSFEGVGDNNME